MVAGEARVPVRTTCQGPAGCELQAILEINPHHVTARSAMKYIIRFKEAASDRTLAPPELRTLLAPRALDKRLKVNQPKQTRFTTRMLPVLQPVLQYIPGRDITA